MLHGRPFQGPCLRVRYLAGKTCQPLGTEGRYHEYVMDPLVAVCRLPVLAERAMRASILAAIDRGRVTPRTLVNDALMRFERAVQAEAPNGVRPALLFGERDRIVRELRGFIDGRIAARLAAIPRRDLVAVGRDAAPFDAIVRNRFGRCYAVILRRLPSDGRRLDVLQRVHAAARRTTRTPLAGVLVYDFSSGLVRLVLDDAGAQRVDRHLRAS